MIREKFVWPSLRADISKWSRECVHCQRAKVGRHVVPPIREFIVPDRRFSHIHADITMMPESEGFRYLLTMIDRFTRWPAAVPLKDITTETVMNAFTHGWISAHGVPQTITTDRGSQFTSELWAQLMSTWGIRHATTTAYHPEANGLVERLHRRLKESLMAHCGEERNEWYYKLPMSLLAIRTTLKPDIGASPADLVYGEGLAVPGDVLPTNPSNDDDVDPERRRMLANLRLEVARLQPTKTSTHRQPLVHVPDDLDDARHVFVQRGGVHPPMTTPYEGPYPVHSKTRTGIKVELPGRGVEEIALARLKPAHVDNDQHQQHGQAPQQPQPPQPPPSPPARPQPRPQQSQPRPPSRLLDPTSRNTRQNPRPSTSAQATSNQTPSTAVRLDPEIFDDETLDNRLQDLRATPQANDETADPFDGHTPADNNLAPCQCDPPEDPNAPCNKTPRFFTSNNERKFSKTPSKLASKEQTNPLPPAPRPKTLTFSNPKPGDFSYRRRKPDVNALREILESLNS